MVSCYLVKPWRRAWGGDRRRAPAAVLHSCISGLGLVGQTIWLLRSGLERQGRAEGGDGKQRTRWGTPAAEDVLQWLGSVRRRPTLATAPNQERQEERMGREEVCEREGLGGVTSLNIGLYLPPQVTCSVPITHSDSHLISLTTDYLPINRPGQLMWWIGAIRVGHLPSSDYQADYLIIRPNSKTMHFITYEIITSTIVQLHHTCIWSKIS
jgi:hypothetical protein